MRFANGLANAEGAADIGRMDEGDEFHSGGTASKMVRIRKLCRLVLQKPYRALSAGPSEGVEPQQVPATGKMPGIAGWGLQTATSLGCCGLREPPPNAPIAAVLAMAAEAG